jgi:hypothetical protein
VKAHIEKEGKALRQNHDFRSALVELDLARNGDRIASQGF